MIHCDQGTTIEPGDPCHVAFRNACCPLCGADLGTVPLHTTGGHLRSNLGDHAERISFAACTPHYLEARAVVARHKWHDKAGYVGQWEPRFGLVVEVAFVNASGDGCRYEQHRVI